MKSFVFYSIGHSIRPIDDFVCILKGLNIGQLADIRSVPKSKTNPCYNRPLLEDTLFKNNICYTYIQQLGGFRSKSKTVNASTNAFWTHSSFKNYADYAFSKSFLDGLNILLSLTNLANTAFMCAEQLWWRCHRRIVTDYLLLYGKTVLNVFDLKNIKPAFVTKGAYLNNSGQVCYPALV